MSITFEIKLDEKIAKAFRNANHVLKKGFLFRDIQNSLTPDLLKGRYGYGNHNTNYQYQNLCGHCYVATEALYHLIGGPYSGYNPYVLNHDLWPTTLNKGYTHWYLMSKDKKILPRLVLDPTENQFTVQVPHEKGKACGFLTKKPSKRAQILIDRVNELQCQFMNFLAPSVSTPSKSP
jgi:hypothetical protein